MSVLYIKFPIYYYYYYTITTILSLLKTGDKFICVCVLSWLTRLFELVGYRQYYSYHYYHHSNHYTVIFYPNHSNLFMVYFSGSLKCKLLILTAANPTTALVYYYTYNTRYHNPSLCWHQIYFCLLFNMKLILRTAINIFSTRIYKKIFCITKKNNKNPKNIFFISIWLIELLWDIQLLVIYSIFGILCCILFTISMGCVIAV